MKRFKLVFPNRNLMWDFHESSQLINSNGNNSTATLWVDKLSAEQMHNAVVNYQATVSYV